METIRVAEHAKLENRGRRFLNWNTWRRFLQSQEGKDVLSSEDSQFHFILDDFDAIGPDGLIWLLLLGQKLAHKNNYLLLTLPEEETQLRYIKSIDFHNVAREVFSFTNIYDLDEVKQYSTILGSPIIKVTALNLEAVKDEVTSYVTSEAFCEKLDISITDDIFAEYIKPLLSRILRELLENIVQHSGTELNTGWGYVVAFISGKMLNICIADIGVAFINGLKRRQVPVRGYKESIEKAFLYGYCKYKGELVEGRGIFDALKCVRKIGGWVKVRSGKAEGTVEIALGPNDEKDANDAIKDLLRDYIKPVAFFPGVQYSILLERPKYAARKHG